MNFKLAYISAGIWDIVGTDLTVARWLTDNRRHWTVEAMWGTDTENWLIRNGLHQAETSSRTELLKWIGIAAESDPLPKVIDASVSVKFLPGINEHGEEGYFDVTRTFFLQRSPCGDTGHLTWWLQARYDDLPGGNWNDNSRTLRQIRQRVYNYYQHCGEIGESAQTIADARAAADPVIA